MSGIRKRLYEIVEVGKQGDFASALFHKFIVALILINVLALVLETVDSIYASIPMVFEVVEIVSLVMFAIEYVIRVWTAAEDPEYQGHVLKARWGYIKSYYGMLDLLAFAPSLLLLLPGDYRVFRLVRIFRLFRLLKLARYSVALTSLENVVVKRRADLISTLMILMVMLLIGSTLMYTVEHEAQPEVFASIPMTMWWGVATLTTVGYGDTYPITPLGKLIGSMVAILGIGFFALPAGIISASYIQELNERHKHDQRNKKDKHRGQE